MVLLVYAIYAFATNLTGDKADVAEDCQNDQYCEFKREVSDENKDYDNSQLLLAQQWLGLSFCIIWIISLRIIKYFGR